MMLNIIVEIAIFFVSMLIAIIIATGKSKHKRFNLFLTLFVGIVVLVFIVVGSSRNNGTQVIDAPATKNSNYVQNTIVSTNPISTRPYQTSAQENSSIEFLSIFSGKEIQVDQKYDEKWKVVVAAVDNFNNEYDDSLLTYFNGQNIKGFIKYSLGGQYSKLSGTVFLTNDYKDNDTPCWYEIYGDNQKLFKSKKIVAGCSPESFSIDISGVNILTINCVMPDNGYIQVGMSNMLLSK